MEEVTQRMCPDKQEVIRQRWGSSLVFLQKGREH